MLSLLSSSSSDRKEGIVIVCFLDSSSKSIEMGEAAAGGVSLLRIEGTSGWVQQNAELCIELMVMVSWEK